MKQYLFTYGSLILQKSKIRVTPIESAFILEYKLFLKSKPNASYLFLLVKKTGKGSDIVSGYLAEVTDEELKRIDAYEGPNYIRTRVTAFYRDNTAVEAFVYVAKK